MAVLTILRQKSGRKSGRKSDQIRSVLVVLAILAVSIVVDASPYPGRNGAPGDPASIVVDPLEAKALEEAKRKLCLSTEEYVKTLKFLRESKDFGFREEASRKIADYVSGGCDGSSSRFVQILTLLKSIGLSERKMLELALEFASTPPDVQKNFLEIFSKSFLAEFFDYEYSRAMRIAIELSTDYKGNAEQVRKDFIALAQFCKNGKKLDLPMAFCSEYAVKVAKLSQYYESGIGEPFLAFFEQLRDPKGLSLDVKSALEFTYGVLQHGPLAPRNFNEAYAFATKDFGYDKKRAMEFGLKMSERSYVGERPPLLQFPKKKVEAALPEGGARP